MIMPRLLPAAMCVQCSRAGSEISGSSVQRAPHRKRSLRNVIVTPSSLPAPTIAKVISTETAGRIWQEPLL
jgi:hypothetical protein